MKLTPLPVPTRIYGGEGVRSYASRACRRNHTDVSTVETSLRDLGVLHTRSSQAPERLQVWRQLGDLHESAFTTPRAVADQSVSDRQLCLKCTRGDPAYGLAPRVGMVCLRHHRWLGAPQVDLRSFVPALSAERRFRTHLARQDILFDSPVMMTARDAVSAGIGLSEIQTRQSATGIGSMAVLIYPEQVTLAQLLVRPSFITSMTEPSVDSATRYERVSREVKAVIPASEDAEPWRAVTRVWALVSRLTWELRDAQLVGRPARRLKGQYELLRFRLGTHSG